MQQDYMLVGGILMILAAIPSLLNSFSRGKGPGVWAVMMIAGFGLVTVVLSRNPNTYSFEGLPSVFVRVIADLF